MGAPDELDERPEFLNVFRRLQIALNSGDFPHFYLIPWPLQLHPVNSLLVWSSFAVSLKWDSLTMASELDGWTFWVSFVRTTAGVNAWPVTGWLEWWISSGNEDEEFLKKSSWVLGYFQPCWFLKNSHKLCKSEFTVENNKLRPANQQSEVTSRCQGHFPHHPKAKGEGPGNEVANHHNNNWNCIVQFQTFSTFWEKNWPLSTNQRQEIISCVLLRKKLNNLHVGYSSPTTIIYQTIKSISSKA